MYNFHFASPRALKVGFKTSPENHSVLYVCDYCSDEAVESHDRKTSASVASGVSMLVSGRY